MSKKYTLWDEQRGFIRTKKGGVVFGEAVYCKEYDMMKDLVGEATFYQVLCLNVLGFLPEKKFADWLEALSICLSYPDARIWCNQVGSLSGTLKSSPVAAASAGILASDSRLYGPRTVVAGMEFIKEAQEQFSNGSTVEQIVLNHPKKKKDSTPIIVGYARPIVANDERVPAMEKVSAKLNFKKGKHAKLAFQIHDYLYKNFSQEINLAGYCSAFFADFGLKPIDVYRLISTWVYAGVLACYAEAYDNPPESFYPLRCEDIEYQGLPFRLVPKK